MAALTLAVRTLHVLLGGFWVGVALFAVLYLDPTVRELGQDGGRFMGALMRRGYQGTVVTVATLTALTGIYLLWQISGGFSSGFMGSGSGILLSTGGLAGILALGVGGHVVSPTGKKLQAVGTRIASSGGAPSPEDLAEMGRLQEKMRLGLRIMAVLVLVAMVTMAIGPHV